MPRVGEAGRQLDAGGVAVIVPRRHQRTHPVGRLLGNDLADVGGRGIGRQEFAGTLEDAIAHGQTFLDHGVQPLDLD